MAKNKQNSRVDELRATTCDVEYEARGRWELERFFGKSRVIMEL